MTTALDLHNQEQAMKQIHFARLINAKTFTSDAQARNWIADMTGTDVDKRKSALRHVVDSFKLPFDFLHGKSMTQLNSYWNAIEAKIEANTKAGFTTGLTHTGPTVQIVTQFESDGNELLRDMDYMAAFASYSVTGTLRAEIVDVISLVTWAEVEISDKLKSKAYKQDSASYLGAQRFGGGLAFHQLDFNNHPMISLNMAISALRVKAVDERINQGYTALQAAITAANGAGQVTTINALGIPATINEARNTLITRNAGDGFRLSFSTPVELYTHPSNYDVIQAALAPWYPTQSSDTVTAGQQANNPIRIVPNTIRIHYTYNLAQALGLGATPACVLVLAGHKNIWADFDRLRFDQDSNFKSDAIEVMGQEYYSQQTNTPQFEIVELA